MSAYDPINRTINGDDYCLRPALDRKTKEVVYSLRYSAYLDVDAIEPNASGLFCDEFDDRSNCINHLLTRNGFTVAAIRTCYVSADRQAQSLGYLNYHEEIEELCNGYSIIESNRFVVKPEFDRLPLQAYILLFAAVLEHRNSTSARFIMGAVKRNHIGFYRRLLNFSRWSHERVYPGLKVPMALFGLDYQQDGEEVVENNPKLLVSREERSVHADA